MIFPVRWPLEDEIELLVWLYLYLEKKQNNLTIIWLEDVLFQSSKTIVLRFIVQRKLVGFFIIQRNCILKQSLILETRQIDDKLIMCSC